MLIKLAAIVPVSQLLVIHASLGDVEWKGALELARDQAAAVGAPFLVAHAFWKDGSSKDFLGMVAKRKTDRPEVPSWPAGEQRYCTSDLKRDPIQREVRRYVRKSGHKLIVMCEGIRAAEGDERAKYVPFKLHEGTKLNAAGRTAWNWLPIFELSTAEVFETIRAAGQTPHWAYAEGNERLSCVFCIYGSKGDLFRGARARPDLYQRYLKMEEATGYTMHMSRKSLAELVAEGQAEFEALAQAA
jgi:3'-phosphoadenosine 5'-phosphosulfate sulfotransferase (PAPS reductase)/FAD synthetase